MTYAPNALDLALAAFMLAGTIVETRLLAACGRVVALGVPARARTYAYTYLIAYQWALVAAVAALWIVSTRPWSALLLGPVNVWRFAGGVVLAVAYVVFLTTQRRAILASPKLVERVRLGYGASEAMFPHTMAERRLWTFAAITAGCCEEVLFRGFLLALVASFTSLFAAVLIGAFLFGLYHANQGRAAIITTGIFGLAMTLIALASGSLVPVILIHIAQDLVNGDLGYRVVNRAEATT